MDDNAKEPDWVTYRKAKEKEEVNLKKVEIAVWVVTMLLVVCSWIFIEKSDYSGSTWPIYSAILLVFLWLYSMFYRMLEKHSKKKVDGLYKKFIGER